MQASTDSIFHIGLPHLRNGVPCQDFALTGHLNGAAYAVVADGCSNGDQTDVGARLLCLATRKAITRCLNGQFDLDLVARVADQQVQIIDSIMDNLELTVRDLLATNLYAVVAPDEGGVIHLNGDGVIALQGHNGQLSIMRFEWDNNTPHYPAYGKDHRPGFIKMHGNNPDALVFNHSSWSGQPGNLVKIREEQLSLHEGVLGYTLRLPPELLASVRYIGLFTDGVTQVDGVDWLDAVTQLLAFKSTLGDFAKRRMNRFLRDIQQQGKGPMDDIGYAVIQLTPDQSEV